MKAPFCLIILFVYIKISTTDAPRPSIELEPNTNSNLTETRHIHPAINTIDCQHNCINLPLKERDLCFSRCFQKNVLIPQFAPVIPLNLTIERNLQETHPNHRTAFAKIIERKAICLEKLIDSIPETKMIIKLIQNKKFGKANTIMRALIKQGKNELSECLDKKDIH